MSEDAVRAYAEAKRFTAITTARWLGLDPADRDALLRVAQQLRLGENQFRDVCDDLCDIGARRTTTVAALLDAPPLCEILARGLGRNEAIKVLKQQLRRLRYPHLSAAESRLAALAKALRLPPGVRVEPPENLEGEHLSVVLSAGSAAELRAQVEALAEAAQRAEIDEMFALLEGQW